MYREKADPLIKSQMIHACEVMYDWEKYNPAIAGGCLWSWAAKKTARDIDIFVKNTWGARKKASIFVLNLEGGGLKQKVIKSNYFGTFEKTRIVKTRAYTSMLPDNTPLDIILAPKSGIENIKFFDYAHCAVGFSPPHTINLVGAKYYASGTLEKWHNEARPESLIKDKIQNSLWNNPNAKTELNRVVHELTQIYDDLKNENNRPMETDRYFESLEIHTPEEFRILKQKVDAYGEKMGRNYG